MVRSLLLEGVSPQEYQTMRACLGVHEQSFRPDDVIYDFGDGRGLLGIVTEGSAVVERIAGRAAAPFWSIWNRAACSAK